MPSPHAASISLTAAERAALEGWARRRETAQGLARRARIVLLACAEGGGTSGAVAQAPRVSRPTVALRRRRFAERGSGGLPPDEPRPGAPRTITGAQVERAVTTTPEAAPPDATRRSTRPLAGATGLSQAAVARIWRAFALEPHRVETFRPSTDPLSVEKVRDTVGLHPSPPERAPVPCVDEKPRVQAVERTAPVLPMRPGRPERRAPDYLRHGTTDLSAALDAKTGTVIGRCRPRHRARESRAFPDLVDRGVPPGLDVHLALDGLRAHKAAQIRDWLARRPRHHPHFAPTSASWLDLVEGWFALPTPRQIRRGVFPGVAALEDAIRACIAAASENPRPFRWTKSADEILDSVNRFCLRTSAAAQCQETSNSAQ